MLNSITCGLNNAHVLITLSTAVTSLYLATCRKVEGGERFCEIEDLPFNIRRCEQATWVFISSKPLLKTRKGCHERQYLVKESFLVYAFIFGHTGQIYISWHIKNNVTRGKTSKVLALLYLQKISLFWPANTLFECEIKMKYLNVNVIKLSVIVSFRNNEIWLKIEISP